MTSVNQRLCSLSVPALATLSTLQKWPSFFFFFFLTDQAFLQFSHCLMSWHRRVCRVKGWSRLHSWELTHSTAKMNFNMCVLVWRLQSPNGNISTPNLHYLFVSSPGFLKATECNSADGFRCTHLSHSATSNFKGVDRKQNMYYEVGDCR